MRILRVAMIAVVCAGALTVTDLAAQAREPFFWGVATSGFQSEGYAPDSNWRRYAERKEPYRDSVDFRHRYPEDIARAKRLGLNVFRFGVEWSRVEPKPGEVDAAELAYYDDVVRRIRAAGMRPMITLDHWVYPGWVADRGGWDNDATVDAWLANARRVVARYRDQGVLWITFNEPAVYVQLEITNGGISPWEVAGMQSRIVTAHKKAYDIIHELDPGAMVSSNVAYVPGAEGLLDLAFVDQWTGKLDFIGVDYHYGASLDNWSAIYAVTGGLWKIRSQPDGIYYALRFYSRKYPDLPLYVVENGMPTDDGKPRADHYTRSEHLRDHVYWIQRAKADGMNVIGYNYWSITDNYEWGSYRPRFGLYTVDVATDPSLTRRPTDAVDTDRELVRNGGVPDDYRVVAPPATCSLVDPPSSCTEPAAYPGPLARLR
ncbi:MAG: glycoside hydrolase family 1 protein [Micromonosporaceae bacterium]